MLLLPYLPLQSGFIHSLRSYIRRIDRTRIARDLGLSIGTVAAYIKTPRGKDVWPKSTVESILKNEKYKGDALLQKTFTTDYLTKTVKINEGEVPQYYVTGSHPAIIDPNEWDLVQLEMERREIKQDFSANIFAGRIICADCGGVYGSKVWHSNESCRKVVWQCNDKYKGKRCTTPHLNEADIKRWFVEAFCRYLKDRDVIIANMRHFKKTCLDPTDLENKMGDVRQELIVTEAALRQCIADNAAASITEEEYRMRYDALYEKFQKLEEEKAGLAEKLAAMQTEAASVDELITCLQDANELSIEFDPVLWRITVQKVLVGNDDMVRFIMAGGKEYSFRIY